MTAPRRKLIEVALPLEAINRESARDSSTLSGHPWNLHYWWARRKLPASRAVLFAQLVDDPSAHPELFPTEAAQEAERLRLFDLIERLVVWENLSGGGLLEEAHAEILRSTSGSPPPILDPFAGGGSIPLEAQRLGLVAHASDLNPVSVLINRALIEIPPRWTARRPVFPGAAGTRLGVWPAASGLAEDVLRYSKWIRDEAETRIGRHYPDALLEDGSSAKVIAWIWARTIRCPNPACGIDMPLMRSFWLSKKGDQRAWLEPMITPQGISFQVATGKVGPAHDGTMSRSGAKCLACSTPIPLKTVREYAQATGLGAQLVALVAEGERRRIYLPARDEDRAAALVDRPTEIPDQQVPTPSHDVDRLPMYGMPSWSDAFTNRQLVAMTTFSDLVLETHGQVVRDATGSGLELEEAAAYADSVCLYLALLVDKAADNWSSISSWHSGNGQLRNVFARQAIPMVWDFAEANPFSDISVGWSSLAARLPEAISRLSGKPGRVVQADATTADIPMGAVVCTDPPYYDNVGYADLSDFFYVWLRRSIGPHFPEETATLLTPKTQELISSPSRFGGSKAKAESHFERGFVETFTRIREKHSPDYPLAVFYAFKQSETDEAGTASTGWETMLNGLLEAGLMITATWPIRTERATRLLASSTNALASSIVLACRPRPMTAEAVNRRSLIGALKSELPSALKRLQQGSIAPVDLAQAAIGPGMAVFSRYSRVVEADGSDMTVRTALALINQVLDEVLTEQEGDFDADTRFCVKWFSQFGWNEAASGEADVLTRATNTSVEGLVRGGVFRAVAGKARLIAPEELADGWDPATDDRVSDWEVVVRLAHAVKSEGVEVTASLMAAAGQRVDLDTAKELAYLLYAVCEKKGWTDSAILFNGLAASWSDVSSAARSHAGRPVGTQSMLDFDGEQ